VIDGENAPPRPEKTKEVPRKCDADRKPSDVALLFKVLTLGHPYQISDRELAFQVKAEA